MILHFSSRVTRAAYLVARVACSVARVAPAACSVARAACSVAHAAYLTINLMSLVAAPQPAAPARVSHTVTDVIRGGNGPHLRGSFVAAPMCWLDLLGRRVVQNCFARYVC